MPELTKLNVLYLDDDADSREMVSMLLNLSHIDISVAKNSDEALSLARKRKYDLYLLDGILTAGDSLQFCREMRRLNPTTPLVFYSARGSRADIELAREAGASSYILKPYFGDLVEVIVRTVTLTSRSRRYRAPADELDRQSYAGSKPTV